jgi:hypothetical protein
VEDLDDLVEILHLVHRSTVLRPCRDEWPARVPHGRASLGGSFHDGVQVDQFVHGGPVWE